MHESKETRVWKDLDDTGRWLTERIACEPNPKIVGVLLQLKNRINKIKSELFTAQDINNA